MANVGLAVGPGHGAGVPLLTVPGLVPVQTHSSLPVGVSGLPCPGSVVPTVLVVAVVPADVLLVQRGPHHLVDGLHRLEGVTLVPAHRTGPATPQPGSRPGAHSARHAVGAGAGGEGVGAVGGVAAVVHSLNCSLLGQTIELSRVNLHILDHLVSYYIE